DARAGRALRRGGRGHDLRRGAVHARRLPRVHARGVGAGAREPDRVRAHAVFHGPRARRRRREADPVSAVRVPRDEQGGARGLPNAARAGDAEDRARQDADSRGALRRARLLRLRTEVGRAVRRAAREARLTMSASNEGLRGVTAGRTAIATVGKQGVGLCYRGYDIEDLAARATFEEVAYLLLRG